MCVAVLMMVVDSPKGGGGGGARGVCVCVCAVFDLRVVGVLRSEGACAARVRRMAERHAESKQKQLHGHPSTSTIFQNRKLKKK